MPFKVVVGLGNYGVLYENTRHNMGFMVVDAFAESLGYTLWKYEKTISAFLLKIPRIESYLLLLKSRGLMNLSGEPVTRVCSFFQVSSAEVVIVCDDITLNFGQVKITERPGTAGHNGVKNILEKIGPGFVRFRVGIGGKKHSEMDLADYVLSHFDTEETETLAKQMPSICNNLQLLLDKGVSSIMVRNERGVCE